MKFLVDCVPLSVGGGVQVAIALLLNLRDQSQFVWQAVASERLRSALPPELASDPRLMFLRKELALDIVRLRQQLMAIERSSRPDVVFTVFGPPYFNARAPHLVGFAMPHLIYDHDSSLKPSMPNLVRHAERSAKASRLALRFRDWLQCVLFRRAFHLVVETQTVRTRLVERLGINSAKISVIGNSINPLYKRRAESTAPTGCRFGILIPSADYPHKNLKIVPCVAAAIRSLDSDLDFEFRFTLDPESHSWRELRDKARQLRVADRLVTIGVLRLDELAMAYHEASIVFLPTLLEASTAVYPESFFFGRSLVTSNMDFARELCGDAAMFVPPLDAEKCAATLVELARSPRRRACLVDAGQEQLLRTYPSPSEKFRLQIDLLRSLAQSGTC
jgi:glycosyltransferase involved in cell wall biosynthesis